ncbi:hypothetical protein [Massilia sp. TSP1-1-2]|uniref:hypothetical protein n=1 Tax=Massilia sp. TSP1-1-2 TaxID=2804649 RepID=UPI003CF8A817
MNILRNLAGVIPARWTAPLLLPGLLLGLLSALPAACRAEDATRAEQSACGAQRADPAAASPDSLVKALYDTVSGPANSAKNWARLEGLHAPGALITPTQHRPALGFAAAPQTLPAFIALNERLFAKVGFYEREIFQRVQQFGHIAHVWSGYETREHPGGVVNSRGVNSFQLLHDGRRWCVLSATWDTDTADHSMPAGGDGDPFK